MEIEDRRSQRGGSGKAGQGKGSGFFDRDRGIEVKGEEICGEEDEDQCPFKATQTLCK